MRYIVAVIIGSMLFLVPFSEAFAEHPKKPVTPYGDFCPRCSDYGTCKILMGHEDAKKAMIEYYDKKGMSVEIEKKRGRFIRAKIIDRGDVVDVIIFDRHTGRVRSIY
ncbi:MAG TPA: hypothetical protein ENH45_05360 [Nitrospirae bacterium]|nr:hypothetical protein BMS3Abin09_00150 [bacterium BMS3Abin09]GBE41819.1 hypothetical protein BMS3Bbin09_01727 [bacterium BMS3Bbin09]HDH34943.1 hypothetical protein [Nitrospirota bacterium]HDN94697.1 hypothetical protein [Nitrospirota bacterium]HDZ84632.1 hypothetical protein [Nitrospirota bacterium]